ncbi:aminotransferase-like domain-containing protein [Bacillus sp. FSL K6-3431]
MKYAEIMKFIDQRMKDGYLKPGSKLPSIRALSEEFSCSKNTVIKAYSEMEKKHSIYSVPKSGYYIVENYHSPRKSQLDNRKIDFLSAGPDKLAMPYRDFQHCINQAIELYKEDMFTYSEVQGLYSLRVQLARHLQDIQVFTVPERICVVSGSQQALNIFVSLPFPNGKTNVCLEQPTHVGFIESIKLQNAVAFGIEVTATGIDLQRLEEIFKHNNIKFFYIVSRFHNPTGYSYSNSEKKRIVELAQKYDVYIIEDDYMGDLDLNLKQDPMFAYDTSGRVIFTKSFSKVMLPGLRLGVTVIPEAMRTEFLRAKFAADLHTTVLTQGALEIYLKSGMFHAHIQKMRLIYSKKGLLLQKAYKELLPTSTSFSGSLSGFYSTIELPNQLKAKELIEHLVKENVYVDNTKKMYLPEFEKETIIRLSVSQVEDELISIGIQKIADAIEELIKKRKQGYIQFI